MPIEGDILVDLTVTEGVFSRVDIRNQRLLTATAPLVGRPASDVPALVTRLFSICRVAQGLASVAAVERAQGVAPAAAQLAARRFLLAGETVLEHAGRVCLDWTQLLGEPPALLVLKSLRATLADLPQSIFPKGDWVRPGGGALHLDAARLREGLIAVKAGLGLVVFGATPPLDAERWTAWLAAGETVASRLAHRWRADGLADYGATTLPALPAFEPDRLESRLAADHDGDFVVRPDWKDAHFFTGPLARQQHHPVVAAVVGAFGRGLLAQLAARVIELERLMREMQDFADGLCDDNPSQFMASSHAHGVAIVEAARGRLAHRVEIKDGRVTRYQILAPPE
ncbi:MAG TPA: nickel-dependent hydrogenase large subunit [Telmatospirillum sp.]|nr:nickel-dependent hydrogenase large subunit [Telmatospirillum sp.]